jgi:dihydrofolate synthase/folylpolyglutamate synthase
MNCESMDDILSFLYTCKGSYNNVTYKLDRVKTLFARLGIDSLESIVIHVAGTNGKGSTCAMLESIYRGAGYSTGLCTSPHLVKINERIQFNRKEITDEDFVKLFKIVKPIAQSIEDENPTNKISFFEYEIAIALLYFKEKKPDVIILEVGLGGRLDATNATRTDISVITTISLDHEDMLGETIASIAREKAGILRPNNKVVVGRNLPIDAMDQIKKISQEKSAPMIVVKNPLPVNLTPGYQNHNAEIAHRVATELADRLYVSESQIFNGILTFKWAARWQTLNIGKTKLIIDGAHNEAGAMVVANEINKIYGPENKPVVIFASNYVTRASKMIKILASVVLKIYLTTSRHELGLSENELIKCMSKNQNSVFKYVILDRVMDIIMSAVHKDVIVTGSLYLAGDIMKELGNLGVEVNGNLA